MAVNYRLQNQFLDRFFSDRFADDFYLANSIDQLQNATQMQVLLKPLDIEAYKKFYSDLSKKLLLSIKPKE